MLKIVMIIVKYAPTYSEKPIINNLFKISIIKT